MTTRLTPMRRGAFPRPVALAGMAIAGLLAGCSTSNTPGESSPDLMRFLDSRFGSGSGSASATEEAADTGGGGSVPPKAEARGPGGLKPKYCYETLANVDCYRQPQAGRERQRVGSFHEPIE